nr:hypothetical protein [Tanacetum cinerariifolium]
GRTAQAGKTEEAHHRGGGRPFQGAQRPAATPGGVLRDGAQAGGRHRPGGAHGRRAGR